MDWDKYVIQDKLRPKMVKMFEATALNTDTKTLAKWIQGTVVRGILNDDLGRGYLDQLYAYTTVLKARLEED